MDEKIKVFSQEMAAEVQKLLPQCRIETREQRKTNDVIWQAVCIREIGSNVEALYYMENAYERYLEGESIEELSQDVSEHYLRETSKNINGIEKITDFEAVRDRICYSLINPEYNQKDLTDRPQEPFMDLMKVYELDASMFLPDGSGGRIAIRNNMLEVWGITEDELKEIAEENTPRLKPACLMTMQEMMAELSGTEPDVFEMVDSRMYVLTNESRMHGASCLAYPGMEKVLADAVGEDYFVLPSSLHEVIVLAGTDVSVDIGELENMIKDINEGQVSKEEWLGDHPYRYDKTLGIVLPVCADERKIELQEGIRHEAHRR